MCATPRLSLRRNWLALPMLMFVCPLRAQAPATPFSVSVVPSHSEGEGASITMAHDTRNEFYVVLTNISDQPQTVWEYWNSWGYRAISFEFTLSEGQKIVVSKTPQRFTVNFPSTFVVQPKEHQVFVIVLNKSWEARPALPNLERIPITLKAIYEVAPTPESVRQGVWTGRIESQGYKLNLSHWPKRSADISPTGSSILPTRTHRHAATGATAADWRLSIPGQSRSGP